jgi:predicted nucleotide-binding protein
MAARRTPAPQPETPILTVDQMRRRIERLQSCIRELEALDLQKVQKRGGDPEVMRIEAAIEDALAAAFGHGTPAYNRYRDAANLDQGPHTLRMQPAWGRGPSINYDAQDAHEAQKYLAEGKVRSSALLKGAISALEAEIADRPGVDMLPTTGDAMPQRDLSKVFVVHGHDEGAREAVARFLERLGIKPIILHEQANQGLTVIEKIEAHSGVSFAVVLLTPDDVGCIKGGTPGPRARQNVVLELGYFIGHLGRKHVCALKRGELEIPSDFGGVVYDQFDDTGGWRQKLATELAAADFNIDWNKVMRP